MTEFDLAEFQTLKRNPFTCLFNIASLGKELLEKEADLKKHEKVIQLFSRNGLNPIFQMTLKLILGILIL